MVPFLGHPVDDSSLQEDWQPKSVGLVWGLAANDAVPHSSHEPGELLQRVCHDYSTINIVSSDVGPYLYYY